MTTLDSLARFASPSPDQARADALEVHRVADRRRSNMEDVCQKLANVVSDLCAFAGDPVILPGVAYSCADRVGRIIAELETFKARDLLNMRKIAQGDA